MACYALYPIGHYESPEAVAERELHEYVASDRTQRIRNMMEAREQQASQSIEARGTRALLEEMQRQRQTTNGEQLRAQAATGKQHREQYVHEERERKRKAFVENRTRAIRTSTTHYRAPEQPVDNTPTLQMSQGERLRDAHDYEEIWQYARNPHDLDVWQREKALADERQERNLEYGQKLVHQAAAERALREQQRAEQLREEQIANERNTAAIKAYEFDRALAKRTLAERVARDMAESVQAQRCKREKERGRSCARDRSAAITKLLEKRYEREIAEANAAPTGRDEHEDLSVVAQEPFPSRGAAERMRQQVVDNDHAAKFSVSDRLHQIQQTWTGTNGSVKQPWLQHYQHTRNERDRVRWAQEAEMHDQHMAEFLQQGDAR